MRSCWAARLRSSCRSLGRHQLRGFASDSGRPRWPTVQELEKGLGTDVDGNPLKIDAATKTISTAAGALPISPLMDPQWVEATKRFRSGKPRGQKPKPNDPFFGRFRKMLLKNPYAQALATPMRTCPATRTTLPRYFLEDMTIVQGPDPKLAWWIPRDLTATPKPREVKLPNTRLVEEVGVTGAATSTAPTSPRREAEETETAQNTEATTDRGPTAYILSRKSILHLVAGGIKSRVGHAHRRFLMSRWRNLSQQPIWRDDMDEFVLDASRQRILDDLLHLATITEGGGSQYLTACATWDAVSQVQHKRGCVLWQSFGLDKPEEDTADGTDAAPARTAAEEPAVSALDVPGEFATMDLPGVKYWPRIPVHNLNQLLGQKFLSKLREGSQLFQDSSIIMLSRKGSLPTQLRLWKLQGYLATFGESEVWRRKQ